MTAAMTRGIAAKAQIPLYRLFCDVSEWGSFGEVGAMEFGL